MNATSVMSLVAATVFAVGVVGPAVAQTPSTPAPAAPAQTPAPAKGGDTQMDKMEKKDKDKSAGKAHGKKRHASTKKAEEQKAAETKAPETKAAPEQPKK